MKAISSCLGLLFALCLVPNASFGAIEYTFTDLGSGDANAINASGQVVGQDGNGNAFLYSNGVLQNLGSGDALGINDAGVVVGQLNGEGFMYSNGSFQTIGTSGYEACGINDSGQVVGTVNFGDDMWIYSNGSFQDLGQGSAYAINASGEVVGSDANVHAFLYSNGSIHDLTLLFPSNYNGQGCSASAINASGQVVGGYNAGAFLYSNGALQFLGQGAAYGINDSGEIVGGGNGLAYAFLYADGSMQDLNDLINPSLGWTLQQANAINDSGQIVGYGINPSGQQDAFLLTPISIPEPSTLAMLGLVSLLALKRQR
jgi:probable HAF family extracellular repeat protein